MVRALCKRFGRVLRSRFSRFTEREHMWNDRTLTAPMQQFRRFTERKHGDLIVLALPYKDSLGLGGFTAKVQY